MGVAQACPRCRAELPPGVAGLYELATWAIERVKGKLERGEAAWAWGVLEADQQEKMDEAVAMLTEAVAQGHGGSMVSELGGLYLKGWPPRTRHPRGTALARFRLDF